MSLVETSTAPLAYARLDTGQDAHAAARWLAALLAASSATDLISYASATHHNAGTWAALVNQTTYAWEWPTAFNVALASMPLAMVLQLIACTALIVRATGRGGGRRLLLDAALLAALTTMLTVVGFSVGVAELSGMMPPPGWLVVLGSVLQAGGPAWTTAVVVGLLFCMDSGTAPRRLVTGGLIAIGAGQWIAQMGTQSDYFKWDFSVDDLLERTSLVAQIAYDCTTSALLVAALTVYHVWGRRVVTVAASFVLVGRLWATGDSGLSIYTAASGTVSVGDALIQLGWTLPAYVWPVWLLLVIRRPWLAVRKDPI